MTVTGSNIEDEAYTAVARLVAAGEYLDTIPGRAQPDANAGGVYQVLGDGGAGGYRRLFSRTSQAYVRAKEAGTVDPLPPLTPATVEQVVSAETALGTGLPPLLRRLYLGIGNGGFGPGYGLLPLGTEGSGADGDPVSRRRWFKDQHFITTEHDLLPICDWGCAILSLVDLSARTATMWGWDPNPAPDDVVPLFPEHVTLAQWLLRWTQGHLYQPCLVQDADGSWRAATQDQLHEMFLEDPDEE